MIPQMLQQMASQPQPGGPGPMPPMGGGPQPGGPPPGGGAMGPQGAAGGMPLQLAQQAAQQMGPNGQIQGLSELVAQLAKHLVGMVVNVPQAAQFQAGKELMETFKSWQKAENSVPAMVPKMAATTPMSGPNTGRADQSALAQASAMQQAGAPPRGMPPQTGMPGQLSQLAAGPRPGGM